MNKSKWLVMVALLVAWGASADDAVLKAKPDAVRGQEIAGMKWGMFVCWSMASAINAPSEWVRTPVEPKQFTATDCDTDQWCQTAKDAGMGYILFLTKHHDGFCLWDTKTTTLNVMNSPLKRDVLAELRKSCDKYGIKLALYFSQGDWPMDRKKATAAEQAAFKKAQLKELLTNYGPVEFIWFDRAQGVGGLDHLDTDKWVRQFQPDCFSGFNHGQAAGRISLRERGTPGPIGKATAMANQMANEKRLAFPVAEFTYPINQTFWFFNVAHPEHPNLSAKKIYADYCGAVKYGNIFSLDVGPNLAGKLRDLDVQTLRQVGAMIRNPPTAQASEREPFTEPKAEYNARAQWLRDAKVGVFIHWNPSSLVGQEISWCRRAIGNEKYDALYKEFKGEAFKADEWIKLFHDAGIRYAVFVPKHHDGFCMFDTRTSGYNVMHSPFGRDYIKEAADACARSDVKFCLYYSVVDWWNPKYSGRAGADLTAYKNDVFKPHMKELLTKYGPVGYIWFDGSWDPSWTHQDGREMYDFIHRLQPATLLGNRIEPRHGGAGVDSFYPGPDGVGDFQARETRMGDYYAEKAWDKCINVSANGWAWVPPMISRPLESLVDHLIQSIGRDGAVLLGVGPRPDGTIDPNTSARLLELGAWLKVNGEAIYGTRGGPYLPGGWGVSTRKGDKVFLFVTAWRNETLTLPVLPAKVKSARLITFGEVSLKEKDGRWTLKVPDSFHRPMATIVELTLDRDAMSMTVVEVPEPKPVSQGKPVTVSGEWPGRERELAKKHANDGNFDTIWAGPEKSRDGWVQIDLGAEIEIKSALVDDHSYNRTRKFEVQAQVFDQWKTIVTGTTIGSKKHLDFTPVKARLVRLVIQEATDTPVVNEFQLFGK